MSGTSKKDEIINTSIQIFVEEGFDRPTMDSIASRCNVSKRTLYKHFPSKRELLDRVFEFMISINLQSIAIEFDKNLSIHEQLLNLLNQKASRMLCDNSMKLAKIIISEHLKDRGIAKNRIEEILKTEKASIQFMESAQKANVFRDDISPMELLALFNQTIHGLAFFPILLGKKDVISEQDKEHIITMFLSIAKKK